MQFLDPVSILPGDSLVAEVRPLIPGGSVARVELHWLLDEGVDAAELERRWNAKLEEVEKLKADLIPDDIHVEVTRNYGETASQKVSELLMHLIGAIVAVSFGVMLSMWCRGGLVLFLSVPVTFALPLFSLRLRCN